MINYYKSFFAQKPSLKTLIYSGDVDIMTVPFAVTRQCCSELPGDIISGFQPWFVNGWTAGYVEVHEQWTLATVKGAGHEVPEYQPLNALKMASRFVKNGKLDESEEQRMLSMKRLKVSLLKALQGPVGQGQMLREEH